MYGHSSDSPCSSVTAISVVLVGMLVAGVFALGATSVQAQERDPDLGNPSAKNQKATSNSEVIDALGIEDSDVASLNFGSSDPAGFTTFSDSAAEFPQKGDSYLTLSTGCAGAALDPDDEGDFSCDLGGLTGPGGATDMVQMELELNVPEGATSVLFDFKYLSEEFPEFVGSEFNDGFVVEVGESTFTVDGSELEAPDNVAFDSEGNPITVNTVFGVSEDESSGTTYDGGTDKLTTSVPVPSGESSITLIFSIFDVSDEIYDSTVFLDNVRFQKQDLELIGLEVNQSIQDWQNSVPLIEDKTTVVRAHLQSTSKSTISPPLNIRLKAYRNGSELENSPQSANNIGSFEAPEHVEVNPKNRDKLLLRRVNLGGSLNFTLPSNWLSGSVTLKLVGDNLNCDPVSSVDENCGIGIDFMSTPTPKVKFYRVKWYDLSGQLHQPSMEKIEEIAESVEAMYPIDDIDYETAELLAPQSPISAGNFQLLSVNQQIEAMRALDLASGASSDRLYYGVVADAEIGGLALSVGGNVASGNDSPTTVAHELGHLLDRPHAVNAEDNGRAIFPPGMKKGYCGSKATTDEEFPYSKKFQGDDIAALGPDGIESEIWGIDTRKMGVRAYYNWSDLMSYCISRWVSSYNYDKIKSNIEDQFGEDMSQVLARRGDESFYTYQNKSSYSKDQEQKYKLVRGRIEVGDDLSGEDVEFLSFASVTTSQAVADRLAPKTGDYTLQAIDDQGNIVKEVSFQPDLGVSKDISKTASFMVPVPQESSFSEVQVRYEGDEKASGSVIGTKTASPNPPSITIESPNGGETFNDGQINLEWSSDDIDGDSLSYTVQYSWNGGGTWKTLNAGLTDTTLMIGTDELRATSEGLFRIQASDGFNTSEDVSDGTFTIPNTSPDASIQAPPGGAEVDTSASVLLKGGATDLEDDQLSGSNLQWSSNIDGSLGTGETVNVPSSGLSVGTHTITLTATDSDGATDEATVTIEVTKPSAETIDQSPKLNDAIPDQGLPLSDSLKYGLGPVFEDPTGEGLTYSALSSDPGVVMPSTEEDTLLIEPVDEGTADVIVTAENPEGVARDTLEVEVTDFPPSAVTNFQIDSAEETPGEEEVALSWQPPKVGDLEGHHVYRSFSPVVDTSGAVRLTDSLTTDTSYVDSTVSSRKTYYYRVTAVDTSGNVSELSSEVRAFLYPDQVAANVSRSFGDASGPSDYRLVALPGRVNQSIDEAIEGEAGTDWQVYWDDGGEFVKYDGSDTFTFRKGRGFWLTSRDEWSVQANFETISLKSDTAAVIGLHDGWNIIANPTGKAIPFNAIQAAHTDTLQVFWPFGGAFNAPADTMQSAQSGVAYYFNNTTGLDSLTLPYPDAPDTKNATVVEASQEKGLSPLVLSARPKGAGMKAASAVRFGFDTDATRGLDPRDLIAPPGRFEQVSLRIKTTTDSETEERPALMSEWRPPISATNEQDSGHTFRLRLASRTETPVSIEVKSFGDMQKRKVVLLYPQTGKTYDLRSNERVTIDPEKEEADLKLAVGTNAYVESQKEKVVPNEVTITSYPNPTRGQATIEYTLPEAQEVTLEVYDVLGRRVATLENGRRQAGRHTLRLDGGSLPSGVYFGRLEAGEQTRSQKITVVR